MKWCTVVLPVLVLGGAVAGCGDDDDSTDGASAELATDGGDMEAFCELTASASEPRDEMQIDEYYAELEEVAPTSLVSDVSTLRSGWKSISMSLGSIGGDAQDVSRPPEVSSAAMHVMEMAFEECGVDGGVYLVLPEAGL